MFSYRGGCTLLMGEKAFILSSLIANVSPTSGILDEKVKTFCQHQWVGIKMSDVFNEKHLRNTYQASWKGDTETQGRETLTHPTQAPKPLCH